MTLHTRVSIERKVTINGVEFEDIHLIELDTMIDEVGAEIAALQVSWNELQDLRQEKLSG